MKRILTLTVLLLCSLLGQAQTEDPPVVVIAAGGKIDYIPADKSAKIKATPGAVLKKSGKVKLGRVCCLHVCVGVECGKM